MFATLLARRAWNIRKSTPRINNERKCLRRCSDPNPRSVIPVRDEIVVEGHASGGGGVGLRSLEVATGVRESSGRIGSGKSEG